MSGTGNGRAEVVIVGGGSAGGVLATGTQPRRRRWAVPRTRGQSWSRMAPSRGWTGFASSTHRSCRPFHQWR
jgi:hypothetical protein